MHPLALATQFSERTQQGLEHCRSTCASELEVAPKLLELCQGPGAHRLCESLATVARETPSGLTYSDVD
eukprot:5286268-Amphidinium_carterae.1